MSQQTIYPPDLDDLLDEMKQEIFANINCIQIGRIEKYTKTEQSVEIQIMVKRRISETEIKSYPLLVDCPLIVLQGGGAFIDMPIKAGDFALVFFNDRDIDNWWTAGNETEPNTRRKHSLSDGFALVGINPKNSALSLDGDKVRIDCSDFPFTIENAPTIDMLGATEEFVLGNTLCNAFTTLCSTIASATSGSTIQNAAGIETIKAAFSDFNGQINTFKSQKIKGE